jgi:hypothetical protein
MHVTIVPFILTSRSSSSFKETVNVLVAAEEEKSQDNEAALSVGFGRCFCATGALPAVGTGIRFAGWYRL